DTPLLIECLNFNTSGNHELIGSPSTLRHGFERPTHRGHFVEKVQYSFLDYISSGFELNFMVAVDFTAIMEVGEVIQFYDSDRNFPVWGFGGRTSDGHVSHAFNLNGTSYGDEVVGVEGIMSAYSSALTNVPLEGPTLFNHIVK
ncbi:unnamed protein product, partial [Eruca vesicaria subsp. sativa]|nr:unnamed protein product [Eruca vesicaria subsp. sativa]